MTEIPFLLRAQAVTTVIFHLSSFTFHVLRFTHHALDCDFLDLQRAQVHLPQPHLGAEPDVVDVLTGEAE
jgi:hypothetical protein